MPELQLEELHSRVVYQKFGNHELCGYEGEGGEEETLRHRGFVITATHRLIKHFIRPSVSSLSVMAPRISMLIESTVDDLIEIMGLNNEQSNMGRLSAHQPSTFFYHGLDFEPHVKEEGGSTSHHKRQPPVDT